MGINGCKPEDREYVTLIRKLSENPDDHFYQAKTLPKEYFVKISSDVYHKTGEYLGGKEVYRRKDAKRNLMEVLKEFKKIKLSRENGSQIESLSVSSL